MYMCAFCFKALYSSSILFSCLIKYIRIYTPKKRTDNKQKKLLDNVTKHFLVKAKAYETHA